MTSYGLREATAFAVLGTVGVVSMPAHAWIAFAVVAMAYTALSWCSWQAFLRAHKGGFVVVERDERRLRPIFFVARRCPRRLLVLRHIKARWTV